MMSGITAGSFAFYACLEGHTLQGPSSRSCGSNGVWSGNEPSCQGEYALLYLGKCVVGEGNGTEIVCISIPYSLFTVSPII